MLPYRRRRPALYDVMESDVVEMIMPAADFYVIPNLGENSQCTAAFPCSRILSCSRPGRTLLSGSWKWQGDRSRLSITVE